MDEGSSGSSGEEEGSDLGFVGIWDLGRWEVRDRGQGKWLLGLRLLGMWRMVWAEVGRI